MSNTEQSAVDPTGRLAEVLSDFVAVQPGRWSLAVRRPGEHAGIEFDAHRFVPAASTIKVLVLAAALREAQRGRLDLRASIPLPPPAERVGGTGVLTELRGVRSLQLADLLRLMIVVSDNVATNAVVDALGFDTANALADELGCPRTRCARRMGDRAAVERGVDNRTTAAEQCHIFEALVEGRVLDSDHTTWARNVLSRQRTRDRLAALLPPEGYCANKAGDQPGRRHDVGLLRAPRERRAVVAVLTDEVPDTRDACAVIARIGLAVYRAVEEAGPLAS